MRKTIAIIFTGAIGLAASAQAQLQGPSTYSTPYVLPTRTGYETTSIFTTGTVKSGPNTGLVDSVGGYTMAGIPDGLGAFDNFDGTFTLLMNHELGNTSGVTRAHGAIGSLVSKWIINKSDFSVVSGQDLITTVYSWNTGTQSSGTTFSPAFNRFCSADLPKVSAFYNPATGLGTMERIYMHGEEGGSAGYQMGTVVTGANAGTSFVLGKFNLATNNSGLTGVGGWENALANPFPQDKTVVIGNNDGGSGIMSNAVAVYVGNKQATGTEIDRAGLTNGALKFVNVVGNTAEIVNSTTRATNITNGTRFTLSGSSSTTFSRPEDGAWNPLNPSQYYFVTTDRIDTAGDGVGSQIGRTRLWRLTFDDITNPDAGGTVDLLLTGSGGPNSGNMFDNMTVNELTGDILLQEDVGGNAHNGKVWQYNPTTDTLTQILMHDESRFGDLSILPTSPFNNDEETSGLIDITSIMYSGSGSPLNTNLPSEAWYLFVDQAHYSGAANGISTSMVEGGQLLALHQVPEPTAFLSVLGGATVLAFRRRRSA